MEHYILISAIISVFAIFAVALVLIIWACTKSRREYRRIKNMAESEGTVTDIQLQRSEDYDYYIVNYSFTDIHGNLYTNNFNNQRLNGLKEGDKILVYYDMDNPDKCVTDYKLNADKNLWWQALLIISVIVSISFIITFVIKD